jgi:hypothetical protein
MITGNVSGQRNEYYSRFAETGAAAANPGNVNQDFHGRTMQQDFPEDSVSLSDQAKNITAGASAKAESVTPREQSWNNAITYIKDTPGFEGYATTMEDMKQNGKVYYDDSLKGEGQYNTWSGNMTLNPSDGKLKSDVDYDGMIETVKNSNLSGEEKKKKIQFLENSKFERDMKLAGTLVHEGNHQKEGSTFFQWHSVGLGADVDEKKAYQEELNFYNSQLEKYKNDKDRTKVINDLINTTTSTAKTEESLDFTKK